MDKRYQVFVSSTYADLQQERQRVIQTLMEMDCIPSGMELFPAADEEQWEFIKRVINDCDYYLLIIGGRYGSTTPEGISYTEKEYDYAIEKGVKVIALLHSNPDDIPVGKSEIVPELRGRLKAFREKVSKNRLVKFWKAADELPGLVALSLSKTIKTYPAIGWIKADQAATTDLLNEVNELRKKNEDLQRQVIELRESQQSKLTALASLDDAFTVEGRYTSKHGRRHWQIETTWRELFRLLAPHLLSHPNDAGVHITLSKTFFDKNRWDGETPFIDEEVFQTIKVQLMTLNLVETDFLPTTKGGSALFWSLTKKGHALMLEIASVKAVNNDGT
jgi:hypothetical protein